ncbi:hypothetical protein ACFQ15_00745 [Sphingomonas hankookensis]|uniref:hypothetical protein n=1 Tax=Sphingomonas hankookensis TaxID=563996 RepID=UPI001F582E5B|nr:hypothetical protein [Sphingomonas hankookensis]
MKHPLLLAATAAAFALSACGQQQPEQLDTRAPDPLASQLANRAPVELPPPVKASVTFRCKDNSLVYVDFFEGDTQANFRAKQDSAPVRLKTEEKGKPLVAEGGYSLTGTPKTITLTQPGKTAQTCNA